MHTTIKKYDAISDYHSCGSCNNRIKTTNTLLEPRKKWNGNFQPRILIFIGMKITILLKGLWIKQEELKRRIVEVGVFTEI